MSGQPYLDEHIDVIAASSNQKPVLANLLELYAHDFSEFMHLNIGRDGRFGYRDLDLYWTGPQRFPFLIFACGELAGFVMVAGIPGESTGEPRWDMAEFFVLRGFRRSSVGTRSALKIFARFAGDWQVRVMRSNLPACAFWNRAVHLFAGDRYRLDQHTTEGREWNLFSFHSPPFA